jgi:hypothetical protein
MTKTYVQDPKTKKFVEKSVFQAQHHAVHTLEPFVSPIDGTFIHDSAQLRAHHKQHGTTDSRDYSPDTMQRASRARDMKLQGLDPASKKDRIEAFTRATTNVRT